MQFTSSHGFRSAVSGFILALIGAALWTGQALGQEVEEATAEGAPLAKRAQDRVIAMGSRLGRPLGPDYRLGPGDELSIAVVAGTANLIHAAVTLTGDVPLEFLGAVPAAGLTLQEFTDELQRLYDRLYTDVEVKVSVTGIRLFRAYLAGLTNSPGSYVVDPLTRVSDLVTLSGGTQSAASKRWAILRRGGEEQRIDLERVIVFGEAEHDVALEPGDQVIIPPRGSAVTVSGAVVRPGQYEVEPGERLSSVLRRAGELQATAAVERAYIERPENGGDFRHIRTNVASALGKPGGAADMPLADGDTIHVPSMRSFQPKVFVAGEVKLLQTMGAGPALQPGIDLIRPSIPAEPAAGEEGTAAAVRRSFPAEPALRVPMREGLTLADLIDIAGRPTADAALREATLTRVDAEGSIEFVPIDLYVLLVEGDAAANLRLQAGDFLRIPSLEDYIGRVTVAGEVKAAVTVGRRSVFGLREGMTAGELLRYAGGATERGALSHAEVTRVGADDRREIHRLDLYAVLRGDAEDLVLQDRDELLVPDLSVCQPTIRIIGPFLTQDLAGARDGGGAEAAALPMGDSYLLYALREGERVSDVVAGAAPQRPRADRGLAVVRRRRPDGVVERIEVDLYRLRVQGDASVDVELQDGDTLVLPQIRDLVYVQGEVAQPGAFPLIAGRTVMDYIGLAGGTTRRARETEAKLRRQTPEGIQTKRVNLVRVAKGGAPDAEMQAGDIIYVPAAHIQGIEDVTRLLGTVTGLRFLFAPD